MSNDLEEMHYIEDDEDKINPSYTPNNRYSYLDLFTLRPTESNNPNKITGKIVFPVVESILLENGQIYKWIFTSFQSGEVMKKKSIKLNKEYILSYFLQHLLQYLRNKEGYKPKKSQNEILEDISKLNLLLERYSSSDKFPDEYKYLEKLNEKKFIFPRSVEHTVSTAYLNYNIFYSVKNKDVLSILELNKVLNDSNKLSMLRIIHNFLDVNLGYHPIICRFYKKNLIDQKKIQLYTPKPDPDNNNSTFITNLYSNNKLNQVPSSTSRMNMTNNNWESKSNSNIFANNNSNYNSKPGTSRDPFRKTLGYKSNNNFPSGVITLNNLAGANFKPEKKSNFDHNTAHDDTNDNITHKKKYAAMKSHLLQDLNNMTLLHNNSLSLFVEAMCNNMVKLLETHYNAILMDGLFRFIKTVDNKYMFFSCDRVVLKKNVPLSVYNFDNFEGMPYSNQKENRLKEVEFNKTKKVDFKQQQIELKNRLQKKPIFGRSKVYERLGNTNCEGEFCEYIIPKHFKNLKGNKDKSGLSRIKDFNSKKNMIKEHSKTNKFLAPEFNNKLSVFLIKRVFDNPHLVNIVLKSYKIFPKNIDSILLKLKDEYLAKESKQKAKLERQQIRNSRVSNETREELLLTGTTIDSKQNLDSDNLPVINNKISHHRRNCSGSNNNNSYINIFSNNKSGNYPQIPNSINNATNNNHNENSKSPQKENENTFSSELALYIPTKDKFRHINSDKIYSEVKICDNCYTIYLLIDGFLNNINEKQSSFINIEKAKHTLLNGDKIVGADELDNPNLQYLYKQDEHQYFDLKKILKREIKKEQKIKSNHLKIRNRVEPSDNNKDLFSYRMNLNLKVLNFNLVAENKQNKFFKIIFDQINSNVDELNRHLNVKSYPSVFSKSMTSLRMHMGINSSSGGTIGSYASNFMGLMMKKNKSEDKYGLLVVDRDLFILYKSLKKQKNMLSGASSFVGGKKQSQWTKGLRKNDSLNSDKSIQSFNNKRDDEEEYKNTNDSKKNKDVKDHQGKSIKDIFGMNDHRNRNNDEKINKKNKENKDLDIDIIENNNSSVSDFDDKEMSLNKDNDDDLENKIIKDHKDNEIKGILNQSNKKESNNRVNIDQGIMNAKITKDSDNKSYSHIDTYKNMINNANKDYNIKEDMDNNNDYNNISINSNSSESIDFPTKLKDKIKQINLRGNKMTLNGNNYKHCLNYNDLLTEDEKYSLQHKIANSEVKKISVQSIFYYEWSIDSNKNIIPYYFTTTPLTIFNEVNLPVYDNPLLKTQEMKIEDFFKICFLSYNFSNTIGSPTINSYGSGGNNMIVSNDSQIKSNTSRVLNPIKLSNHNKTNNIKEMNTIFTPTKRLDKEELSFQRKSINDNNNDQNDFNTFGKSNQNNLNSNNANLNTNNNTNNNIKDSIPTTLLDCEVFVYNQNTAVPYKVEEIYNDEKEKTRAKKTNTLIDDDLIEIKEYDNNSLTNSNVSNDLNKRTNDSFDKNSDSENNKEKTTKIDDPYAVKLLIITINDFYDSFTRLNTNVEDSVYKSVLHFLSTNNNTSYIDKNYTNNNNDLYTNINNINNSIKNNSDNENKGKIDIIKHVKFNLPGQPYTVFKKPEGQFVMNNYYYAEFLDRFLYYLNQKQVFDSTYRVMIIGIGNGGQIALTFASLYEKYWSMLLNIILFNTYLENDDFLNKSMIEILKIIENSADSKIIDFFIRSITVNPAKLLQKEDDLNRFYSDNQNSFNNSSIQNNNNGNNNNKSNIDGNSISKFNNTPNNYNNNVNSINTYNSFNNNQLEICSIPGFYAITKGYFYNLQINLNDITTPVFCIHSNQNCFITINNLNKYFSYLHAQSFIPTSLNTIDNMVIDTNRKCCEFQELISNEMASHNIRKKLLIIDGSHDVFSEDEKYFNYIIEYFFDFMLFNYKEVLNNNSMSQLVN